MSDITIHHGRCEQVLTQYQDNHFDSGVMDPPYGLGEIKDPAGLLMAWLRGEDGQEHHGRKGFMGNPWDAIVPGPHIWREIFRVMKPGAHVLVFAGSRIQDLMSIALRLAGFEVRDTIMWVYGSGFPKSRDVSKAIDKAAGAEREVIAEGPTVRRIRPGNDQNKDGTWEKLTDRTYTHAVTAPATDAAKQWEGWGTALKPAYEPILVVRKPLVGTVVDNVLQFGAGALNIDGCKVATDDVLHAGSGGLLSHIRDGKPYPRGREGEASADRRYSEEGGTNFAMTPGPRGGAPNGRWPANVIHDGSDEVLAEFAKHGEDKGAAAPVTRRGSDKFRNSFGRFHGQEEAGATFQGDAGSAARFFYCAKASPAERAGSKHPTIKPLALIRYLTRLVTPPGGKALDGFGGSGTFAEACVLEGVDGTVIEMEEAYLQDIERRIERARAGESKTAKPKAAKRTPARPAPAREQMGFSF